MHKSPNNLHSAPPSPTDLVVYCSLAPNKLSPAHQSTAPAAIFLHPIICFAPKASHMTLFPRQRYVFLVHHNDYIWPDTNWCIWIPVACASSELMALIDGEVSLAPHHICHHQCGRFLCTSSKELQQHILKSKSVLKYLPRRQTADVMWPRVLLLCCILWHQNSLTLMVRVIKKSPQPVHGH